jgi:predicted DNA-binding protein (MmcQ/YjbR family)
MKPIMSVKESRKLLGKKYTDMTDEKIEELIEQTHELAKIALEVAKQERLRKNV